MASAAATDAHPSLYQESGFTKTKSSCFRWFFLSVSWVLSKSRRTDERGRCFLFHPASPHQLECRHMHPCQFSRAADKSAVERQETLRAGTARKMQGVCEINSQSCPVERLCHSHWIFQSHIAQPCESFKRFVYFGNSKSVQPLQHPRRFKKHRLGNPYQPARQKRSSARCLRRVISRQKTHNDVSICRDHGVSSFPLQSPCPSPPHSLASPYISGTRKRGLWLFRERAAAFSEKRLPPSPPRPILFHSPIFVSPAATLAVPLALWTIFWLFSLLRLIKSKTFVRHPDQYTPCLHRSCEIPFHFAHRITPTCAQTLVSVECAVFQSRESSLHRGFMPESYRMGQHYDVIVIGGGHNGLVNAAYLAKAGKKVVVLERRHVLGGAAVTEEIIPGFLFSECSYVVSLLRPEIIRELDLPRHGLEILPLDGTFSPMPNGDFLWRMNDHAKSIRDIRRHSRLDAEAYDEFSKMMTPMCRFVKPLLSMIPPDPTTLNPKDLKQLHFLMQRFRELSSDERYTLIQLMTMSSADFLDQWFETDVLKATMSASGIIGTFLGIRSPGTAYVLLHHYMGEIDGAFRSWGFSRGGTGAISNAIAG